MPSIRSLYAFVAVARTGSFTAAAHELGLTPAAVGLQMKALEEDLGIALFDRRPRSVVLNTAGREATLAVGEILARYEALAARRGGDNLSGTLVMGALVSALMGAFADALWALKHDHPQLDVRLFAGMSREFAQKVDDGGLDAAVVTRPPHALASGLAWTLLYSEPMVLIVPVRPHFELPRTALRMLHEAPFIRFDRQTWTGYLVRNALRQAGVKVRDEMELNSVEAIIELVRAGFGISIVPRLANVQWKSDTALRVIGIPGVNVSREVGLLERSRHQRMQATAAIKAHFAARVVRLAGTTPECAAHREAE
ncbi:MAG: LysR family transcriptional regulator [Casimicrobiaceae bacterium]